MRAFCRRSCRAGRRTPGLIRVGGWNILEKSRQHAHANRSAHFACRENREQVGDESPSVRCSADVPAICGRCRPDHLEMSRDRRDTEEIAARQRQRLRPDTTRVGSCTSQEWRRYERRSRSAPRRDLHLRVIAPPARSSTNTRDRPPRSSYSPRESGERGNREATNRRPGDLPPSFSRDAVGSGPRGTKWRHACKRCANSPNDESKAFVPG